MDTRAKRSRNGVPPEVAAQVQYLSSRTCCVCCVPRKPFQIHHIDGDSLNHELDNLALLCLECHYSTQISGGFARKLDPTTVRYHREQWYATVARTTRPVAARPVIAGSRGQAAVTLTDKESLVQHPRSETQEHPLVQIASAVRAGNCSVLVSTDLGTLAGYPDLSQLVISLAQDAGLALPHQQGELTGQQLRSLADECLTKMGDDEYLKRLEARYSALAGAGVSEIHSSLVQIPFNAILTTNLDPSLEIAALQGVRKGTVVHTYPDLEAAHLRSGHIYHLHGRASDARGHSQVTSMVITESDHQQAYQEGYSPMRPLIQDLLSYQAVLFVGSPAGDSPLGEIVRSFLAMCAPASLAGGDRHEAHGRILRHFALVPGGLVLDRDDPLAGHDHVVVIPEGSDEDPLVGLTRALSSLCAMVGLRSEAVGPAEESDSTSRWGP